MNKTFIAALALAATLPAHAALTTNPGDIGNVVVDFEMFDGFYTTGPETVAPGVTFSGDEGSQLGAFIADLGTNGTWGAGNYFAATDGIGELRFTFDTLTQGAGALVNHFALPELPMLAVVVSAYGDNNQIIETYNVPVVTMMDSLNAGSFVGITRDSADIRSISFKGYAIVLDNVAVTAPVPEPETYAMLLAGLGLIGMVARRRM